MTEEPLSGTLAMAVTERGKKTTNHTSFLPIFHWAKLRGHTVGRGCIILSQKGCNKQDDEYSRTVTGWWIVESLVLNYPKQRTHLIDLIESLSCKGCLCSKAKGRCAAETEGQLPPGEGDQLSGFTLCLLWGVFGFSPPPVSFQPYLLDRLTPSPWASVQVCVPHSSHEHLREIHGGVNPKYVISWWHYNGLRVIRDKVFLKHLCSKIGSVPVACVFRLSVCVELQKGSVWGRQGRLWGETGWPAVLSSPLPLLSV